MKIKFKQECMKVSQCDLKQSILSKKRKQTKKDQHHGLTIKWTYNLKTVDLQLQNLVIQNSQK